MNEGLNEGGMLRSRNRFQILVRHLTSTAATPPLSSNATVNLFLNTSSTNAWSAFCALPTWRERVAVASALRQSDAYETFLRCYRKKMEHFILPSFYNIIDDPVKLQKWRSEYQEKGEINIPLLRPSCLPKLGQHCNDIEHKGKRRYSQPRPSYPPGEWATWSDADPRKAIQTDVNMTAVSSRHLEGADDDILWIYHSPHLQLFIERALGCNTLFPYLNDLGIAVNIMQPRPTAQTALGFHFDSVDSSIKEDKSKNGSIQQAKGVTGVIGLVDADDGGERIVFPNVHRENVKDVSTIVQKYNPLSPNAVLSRNAVPKVEMLATAGMLYLFDGGNVLHGVSSVR